MNTKLVTIFALLALLASACAPSAAAQPLETATPPEVKEEAGAAPVTSPEPAVLLFTIGMHIEPLGKTAQGYQSGKGDYRRQDFFDKHAQDILAVTQIVEAHGGRMTIQAQSPVHRSRLNRGIRSWRTWRRAATNSRCTSTRTRISEKIPPRGRCRNGAIR